MSDLKDILNELKISYTVGIDDPLKDFFLKCLDKSKIVNICTGFFSSNIIRKIIPYSYNFFKNGGKMNILSGFLNYSDASILIKSKEKLYALIKTKMIKSIEELENYNCRDLFIYLLYKDYISLKFGLLIDKFGFPLLFKNHMMHEKFGYFEDDYGIVISFSGSINYTENAWFHNKEEFKVFNNVEPIKKDYCQIDIDKFRNYWNSNKSNLNKNIIVSEFIKFPEKIKRSILKLLRYKEIDIQINKKIFLEAQNGNEERYIQKEIKNLEVEYYHGWKKYKKGIITLIESLDLRSCQENAIKYLKKRTYSGILSMATGTGKTIAAIRALYEIFQYTNFSSKLIIVCVPDTYLVKQWEIELSEYFDRARLIFPEKSDWKSKILLSIDKFNLEFQLKNNIESLILIGVSKSLNKIYSIIQNIAKMEIIFIGDEIHALGSPYNIKSLTQFTLPKYRIGLSATPIRKYDEKGTKSLLNWFGITKSQEDIFKYDLKMAQNDGILEKFEYFPIYTECSNYSFSEFKKLTKKIKKIYGKTEEIEELKISILAKRAGMLKLEENKDIKLNNSLINHYNKKDLYNTVVYCHQKSQIQRIENKLNKVTWKKHISILRDVILGTVKKDKRKQIINQLVNRKINFLFAIGCLDQGVDIPSLKRAYFISSSTTTREHIQRAGRVLRKQKGIKKNVEIYDFFVIPTDYQIKNNPAISAMIFQIEFKRFTFFSKIAEQTLELYDEIDFWNNLEKKFLS